MRHGNILGKSINFLFVIEKIVAVFLDVAKI